MTMRSEGSGPIRVLIVDDHPVVRQGLRSMLETDDVEVVGEAGSGSEAIALVEGLQPDVTLLDIRMPDMDGITAMAAMKKLPVNTSIIVLTTYNNMQYLVRSVIYGAAGYFMKGISRDELLAAIRAVAEGQSLLQVHQLRTVIERLVREDAKAAPHAVKKLDVLTPRERETLNLVAQGLTNEQVAHVLGISRATVKTHVENIIGKLGVSDRTQAAVWAVRSGLAGL
jgi:DNA-binding NarL/FixJ family response regulator